jgi:hypothetical protein
VENFGPLVFVGAKHNPIFAALQRDAIIGTQAVVLKQFSR